MNVRIFIVLLMCFLPKFSFAESLFPGPAQAPEGMSNTLIDFDSNKATIEVSGQKNIKLGFEKFVYQSDGLGSYCSDSQTRFGCIHDPNFRAKNINLETLVIGDGPNDLVLADETWNTNCGYQEVCRIKPSDPNYSEYNVGAGSTLYMDEGVYYFGTLSFNYGADVIVNGKVEIHVNQFISGGLNSLNARGRAKDLIIYHHNKSIDMDADEDKLSINYRTKAKAYIYSSGLVHLQADAILQGAVTARQLHMNDNSKIIFAGNITGSEYQLSITPGSAAEVGCERVPLTFSVQDSSGHTQPFNGKLFAKVTSGKGCFAYTNDPAENCKPNHSIELDVINGEASIWLGGGIGDAYISATFDEEENKFEQLKATAGPYHFGTLGFSFNDGEHIKLVAGKPENLKLEFLKSIGQGNSQMCKADS